MPLLAESQCEIAVEIMYSPTPLRLWTGDGDLVYETNTYTGGGIVAVGDAEIESEQPIDSFGFDLSALSAANRTRYLNADPGPLQVNVRWMWRASDAEAWKQAALYSGRLNEFQYTNGVLSVSVKTVAWDVDRGETLLWDNQTQQRLYPGDLGFGYASQLLGEGGAAVQIPWPPA